MIIDSIELRDRSGFELILGSPSKETVEEYLNDLDSGGWEMVNMDFEDQGRHFIGVAKREVD